MRSPLCFEWIGVVGLVFTIIGCGGDDTECGPNTVEKDGKCVSKIQSCAPGTHLVSSRCVPLCTDAEIWDGSSCVPKTQCGPGTRLQADRCVSVCEPTQTWNGTACETMTECAPGTSYNDITGECEPNEKACAPGSSWVDGQCVSDLACGPGTKAENGQCVPEGLPVADVVESSEPDGAAEFKIPNPGKTIILGGVIDEPPGFGYPDWDTFVFDAKAGTYLQLEAYSAGPLRPAFVLESKARHPDGSPRFSRYGAQGEGVVTRREVYLPFDGTYELRVTDHDHLLASLFSNVGALPVGGDNYAYVVEIQNLGAPKPKKINTLPATESGDLADGSLYFYSFPGAKAATVVSGRSVGVPPPAKVSDIFRALMAVNGSGQSIHERVTSQTQQDTEVLVLGGSSEPMIVQDHLLAIGPHQEFLLEMDEIVPKDCTKNDCKSGSLADNEQALWKWNLAEGDFLTVGAYLPNENRLMKASLLDSNLQFTMDDSWVSPWDVGVGYLYASEATSAYLWLREVEGEKVNEYLVDARVVKTPAFSSGQTYKNLPLHEMPPYTLRNAGIGHFKGEAGKVVFFSGFSTKPEGAWQAPQELLMTPHLEPMGPVIDTKAWNFPDGFVTPLFGYIKDDGHYLHYVFDGGPPFSGGTYETRMTIRNTFPLGKPAQGAPIEVSNHNLSQGLALYTFEANAKQYVDITVTPTLISGLVPDLWIFNFGRPEFAFVNYRWVGDMSSPRLGLIHRETGTSSKA
ncbi:MAG TPA: hypothetical protein PKW66_15375, partial [Polyangiaceae bacterium]|nr:hypothetical protein [Polyangiaceae bacterium]